MDSVEENTICLNMCFIHDFQEPAVNNASVRNHCLLNISFRPIQCFALICNIPQSSFWDLAGLFLWFKLPPNCQFCKGSFPKGVEGAILFAPCQEYRC